MNIYEYALKVEQDGYEYYKGLAEKAADEGLKTIFNMLAEEEMKHIQLIEGMQQGEQKPELLEHGALDGIGNIFEDLKKRASETFSEEDKRQKKVYFKAAELEKDVAKFYTEKAREVQDDYQSKVFLQLAEEEMKHHELLDEIGEYVGAPDFWDANPEDNNPLEDY